jgi:hypothetical protein
MTPFSALITYMFIAISLLGLVVFPIFIIMEQKGNPVMTRYHPEDTQERIDSLLKVLAINCLILFNCIVYVIIDSKLEAASKLTKT